MTFARKAALIVIGKVTDSLSFLNAHNTGVFTESEIEVSEILKADSSNPVARGSSIFLVRPDGVIRVGEHFIEEINGSQTPLHKGDVCLLLLTAVNEAPGAFSGSTYVLNGDSVKDADDQGADFESLQQARQ